MYSMDSGCGGVDVGAGVRVGVEVAVLVGSGVGLAVAGGEAVAEGEDVDVGLLVGGLVREDDGLSTVAKTGAEATASTSATGDLCSPTWQADKLTNPVIKTIHLSMSYFLVALAHVWNPGDPHYLHYARDVHEGDVWPITLHCQALIVPL
ncbi:MAG: hypothetical protein PVI09_00645 [Anaerolineae bacterium]|jgi:hypothetical protein